MSNPFQFTRSAVVAAAVTIAEAKVFCQYQESDIDSQFTSMVKAATEGVEDIVNRQFITATYTGYADCFPGTAGIIQLQRGPFIGITSIKYYDVDGVQQTLDAAKYALDTAEFSGRVLPTTWDDNFWPATQARSDAVEVIYTSGQGAATTNVAEDDRIAVLQQVLIWFNREAPVGQMDKRLSALLWKRRMF